MGGRWGGMGQRARPSVPRQTRPRLGGHATMNRAMKRHKPPRQQAGTRASSTNRPIATPNQPRGELDAGRGPGQGGRAGDGQLALPHPATRAHARSMR